MVTLEAGGLPRSSRAQRSRRSSAAWSSRSSGRRRRRFRLRLPRRDGADDAQVGFGLLVLALNVLTLGCSARDRRGRLRHDPLCRRGRLAGPQARRDGDADRDTSPASTALGARSRSSRIRSRAQVLGQAKPRDARCVLGLVLPLTVTADLLSAAVSGLELASGELVRKVTEQGGRILFSSLLVRRRPRRRRCGRRDGSCGSIRSRGGRADTAAPTAARRRDGVARPAHGGLVRVAADPRERRRPTLGEHAVIALAHYSGTRSVALWGAATRSRACLRSSTTRSRSGSRRRSRDCGNDRTGRALALLRA